MQVPNFVKQDNYLHPYAQIVIDRLLEAENKEKKLLFGQSLPDFAQGHKWYGLHKEHGLWVLRDWAPNATAIYLVGEFNSWQEQSEYALSRVESGDWELRLPFKMMKHGDLFAFSIHWHGGQGKRVPDRKSVV